VVVLGCSGKTDTPKVSYRFGVQGLSADWASPFLLALALDRLFDVPEMGSDGFHLGDVPVVGHIVLTDASHDFVWEFGKLDLNLRDLLGDGAFKPSEVRFGGRAVFVVAVCQLNQQYYGAHSNRDPSSVHQAQTLLYRFYLRGAGWEMMVV